MPELRPGDPIEIRWEPTVWWPAVARDLRELEGEAMVAGEAFGPLGQITTFALPIFAEGIAWRRRDADALLARLVELVGADDVSALPFYVSEALRARDRWAGRVKVLEERLARVAAAVSGKFDPALEEIDRLKGRNAEQHEALMECALATIEARAEGEVVGIYTPAPRDVVAMVRGALGIGQPPEACDGV